MLAPRGSDATAVYGPGSGRAGVVYVSTVLTSTIHWDRLANIDWDRLALLGCLTVGIIVGVFQAIGAVADPYDARIYWQVDFTNMYPRWYGGYVYPPPFVLLLAPIHPLGWAVFITAFTTATWAAFWYCARAFAPLVIGASFLLVPLLGGNVVGYLFIGNIQFILAAAIVASIRLSAAWSVLPLLTKLVPVPLIWYAIRREWRNLGIGIGLTAAIVAITFALAPNTWIDFYRFVTTNPIASSPVPLVPIAYPIRLVAAVLLTAWGGLTDRRWTVPIAAGLAIPALYQWSFLPFWVAVIGIEWPSGSRQDQPTAVETSDGRTMRAPSS